MSPRAGGDEVLGDVVVYGAALWDSPWLTEHHLARALARRTRVLFLEPPLSLAWPLRATGTRGKAAAAAHLVRRSAAHDGVQVARLLTLPPVNHPAARARSDPWIRRQVAAAIRRSGLAPRTVITAHTLREGLPAMAERPFRVAVVKDWLQAGAHLTGLEPELLRERELRAWRSADLVCAVSRPVQERLAADGIPARLLRHGFPAEAAARYEAPARVPELAVLPRPLLGCVGRLDGRLAFEQLERVADEHPGGSVVLVGPLSPLVPRERFAALLARPNVFHFPAVAAPALPAWLAALDCCVVPYVADDWQRFASPLKVWDYLYAGCPIAATGAPALADFPDGLLHFALDERELPRLVRDALAEGPSAGRAARRAHAAANTWDRRAEELAAMVAEVRAGARGPRG